MTIRAALAASAEELRSADGDTPYLDAVLLLCHALHMGKEQLYARLPDPLTPDAEVLLSDSIRRRLEGAPVAYIRGRKEFYGREFAVDERVLVPRPDTETLVEAALQLIGNRPLRVHDCCTGSGCVAITIRAERPSCEVSASDISEEALQIARDNAAALLPLPISFYRSDLLTSVPGNFDLITANPPYVLSTEVAEMAGRGWREPLLALDGGIDGLDVVRVLVENAVERLNQNGYICVETADSQAEPTCSIMERSGFAEVHVESDLAGRRRVSVGRKSN